MPWAETGVGGRWGMAGNCSRYPKARKARLFSLSLDSIRGESFRGVTESRRDYLET